MPSWDFSGRKAVVTGGAQGIGRTIAQALRHCGAEVFVFDLHLPPDEPNGSAALDIGDADAVREAVQKLPDDVSLLVNNAGITRDRSIGKMTDEEWRSVIDVNLGGAFNLIRALSARMRSLGRGRIVNISSINGMRGKFGQANYSAAKAGLIGLTKTAARELGPKGITVNAVAPGMVLTDMALALPPEYLKKATEETALNELAKPEDVADAVMFLLSDAARMITGEVIKVDAGQYI